MSSTGDSPLTKKLTRPENQKKVSRGVKKRRVIRWKDTRYVTQILLAHKSYAVV
jgi:hypothetical protein